MPTQQLLTHPRSANPTSKNRYEPGRPFCDGIRNNTASAKITPTVTKSSHFKIKFTDFREGGGARAAVDPSIPSRFMDPFRPFRPLLEAKFKVNGEPPICSRSINHELYREAVLNHDSAD
uniref:Uncharacterized protein n=1 Tax=Anopheles coluzzii TaxID=1518534 RepID=A0A8W7P7L9_ANOCL